MVPTAVALLAVLLTGCATSHNSYEGYASVVVGDETVYLVPADASTISFPDLRTLVSLVPVIFEATVVSATDIAAEVQPSADEEGVIAGKGPDLYGAITFQGDISDQGPGRQ